MLARKLMSNRRAFIAAGVALAGSTATAALAAATPLDFDHVAFEARTRAPFRHKQVFAAQHAANGNVLRFMKNSLDAYERGFAQGPASLHAAAVLYSSAVALAFDDAAWQQFKLSDLTVRAGDAVASGTDGNPYLHGTNGSSIGELQARNASFFACSNALHDLANRAGTSAETLASHLIPGVMVVPAGVAAINWLQEEQFMLFVAS